MTTARYARLAMFACLALCASGAYLKPEQQQTPMLATIVVVLRSSSSLTSRQSRSKTAR